MASPKKSSKSSKAAAADEPLTPPPPGNSLFAYGSAPTPKSFPALPIYVYYFRVCLGTLYGASIGMKNAGVNHTYGR